MKITVWGARGSIPVSGAEYLRYGGDTTCLAIESAGGELVVLDAGTGVRRLGRRLVASGRKRCAFLLTHAHWDHLIGFPFFRPLYDPDFTVNLHGCRDAQQSLRTILSDTMRAPFFPIDLPGIAARLHFHENNDRTLEVAGLEIRRIPLNHPNLGCGFIIREGRKKLVFFPDNELGDHPHAGGLAADRYAELFRDADLLIHDAEYLPGEYHAKQMGWGHSSCLDTADLAVAARADRLLLWHLNQDRTDAEADALLAMTRERLAARGADMPCDVARTDLRIEI